MQARPCSTGSASMLVAGRWAHLCLAPTSQHQHAEHAAHPAAQQGLETLVNLRILDVSNNRISRIEGLEPLDKVRSTHSALAVHAALQPCRAAIRCLDLSVFPARLPGRRSALRVLHGYHMVRPCWLHAVHLLQLPPALP